MTLPKGIDEGLGDLLGAAALLKNLAKHRAEANEQGINAVSGKCTMFGNARTVIEDPGRCFMKLVADRDTGRLIGAQLMCQHASDIISQLSAALVNGLTVRQLLAVMRPHPSFEEAMTEALERLAEKL